MFLRSTRNYALIVIASIFVIYIGVRLWRGELNSQDDSHSAARSEMPVEAQSGNSEKASMSSQKKRIDSPTSDIVAKKNGDIKSSGDPSGNRPENKLTDDELAEMIQMIMGEDGDDITDDHDHDSGVSEETHQSVSVPADARRVEVERGIKYRVTSYGVGTWNPRPMTPEEKQRYKELSQELVSLHPLGASSKEKRLEIQAELNVINSETSRPGKVTNMVWYRLPGQEEPSDDEIVEMDLGVVTTAIFFVAKE